MREEPQRVPKRSQPTLIRDLLFAELALLFGLLRRILADVCGKGDQKIRRDLRDHVSRHGQARTADPEGDVGRPDAGKEHHDQIAPVDEESEDAHCDETVRDGRQAPSPLQAGVNGEEGQPQNKRDVGPGEVVALQPRWPEVLQGRPGKKDHGEHPRDEVVVCVVVAAREPDEIEQEVAPYTEPADVLEAGRSVRVELFEVTVHAQRPVQDDPKRREPRAASLLRARNGCWHGGLKRWV